MKEEYKRRMIEDDIIARNSLKKIKEIGLGNDEFQTIWEKLEIIREKINELIRINNEKENN